ncbi:MAG TPA: hypothetical protein VM639_12480 [Dongiaceae bacterium]|nr:hypothetical protein [Dongiaceae bacterium]
MGNRFLLEGRETCHDGRAMGRAKGRGNGRSHRQRARITRAVACLLPAGIAAGVVVADLGLAASPAEAATCKRLSGIAPSIDRFIDKVYALQLAGRGTLPVTDALFGFRHLDADGLRNLDQRQPIEITRQDEDDGVFINKGPKPLVVTGSFAQSETFFDIPELVKGSYVSTPDSLTLTYDPDHAVKVGQSFLGMKFSHTINHTVITRHSLAYFFDDNSSSEPDRCYVLVDTAEVASTEAPDPDAR